MLLASLGFPPRLCAPAPVLARTIFNRAALRPVPPTRTFPPLPSKPSTSPLKIATPQDFLKAIGRSSEGKLTTGSWEEFWKTSGHEMRKAGLAIQDRRYILWCMQKYRQGFNPQVFAHEAKPKKTVRGWGPAVQNGKRIRSRRLKNKN